MHVPRILVIDDSELTLSITQQVLEDEGFDVDVAGTVAELEAHRLRSPPDLFLVDVKMPETLGDELVGRIRRAATKPVPILLLSGLPDDELAKRAAGSGATGFISKLAGAEAMVALVRHLISTDTTA